MLPVGSNPIGSSLSPGIDYTIVMDGAPGPVRDCSGLKSVFTSVNLNDHMQTVGSVKIIRSIVSNIIAIG